MANLQSSKKDIRRIAKRTEHNRGIRSTLKTLRKKVLGASEADKPAAVSAYNSAVDKAVKTGIVHANKANRLKSRAATKA